MVILTAAALILSTILILIIISMTRQIENIRRRLDFIKSHKTNMRISSGAPFKAADRLADSINGMLDETARERLAAEQESRALKETLTGISHDIRTPLTSLSGYVQLLSGTEDPAERERYTAVIKARIRDLEAMLEQLFTYTKLQNSDYTIELSRVDFTKCVIDEMLGFYGQFAEAGITLQADIDETPVYILGNSEAVRRILQNVLKNALTHGKDGISASLCSRDGQVIFTCSNRCENPDEVDIENVFTKFYKADAARKDASTGLGLTIARELAERLGGRLSASLEGDIFTVSAAFRQLTVDS